MNEKVDYKKKYKDLYMPKTVPMVIDVPEIPFIMVDGMGDPNTSKEYQEALEILYGLSFAIKMSKMNGTQPERYFDYVVPPLEGLWQGETGYFDGIQITDKSKFRWISMIRQPEFVTEQVFENAKKALKLKKPELDLSKAYYKAFGEGLCVQIMHIGAYDDEPLSVKKMNDYLKENGYENDFSETRLHHELYLNDPRRTSPDKLKTVIRHPIKKVQCKASE